MKRKPNKIRQRRRLADMDMSKMLPHRVGFTILNPPDGWKWTKVTTAWTDPAEAEKAAIMILDAACRQKGIEPPPFWELEMKRLPPITH